MSHNTLKSHYHRISLQPNCYPTSTRIIERTIMVHVLLVVVGQRRAATEKVSSSSTSALHMVSVRNEDGIRLHIELEFGCGGASSHSQLQGTTSATHLSHKSGTVCKEEDRVGTRFGE
jgi:hypothetical protein